ncbi:hypothetical protein L1049_015882 [Liquidambar formosana]|uniref:Uncharacterized protein n=1 Tax=Liquidambar formosana TaxID=63359 RepID=A0AAP0S4C0_LIQFO
MRSTRGKANKQCKFMQFILAPFRILGKARDFYVKSISDLVGGVGYGGMAGCLATPSFGLASSKASNNKELRELIRSVTKRSMGSKVEGGSIIR